MLVEKIYMDDGQNIKKFHFFLSSYKIPKKVTDFP